MLVEKVLAPPARATEAIGPVRRRDVRMQDGAGAARSIIAAKVSKAAMNAREACERANGDAKGGAQGAEAEVHYEVEVDILGVEDDAMQEGPVEPTPQCPAPLLGAGSHVGTRGACTEVSHGPSRVEAPAPLLGAGNHVGTRGACTEVPQGPSRVNALVSDEGNADIGVQVKVEEPSMSAGYVSQTDWDSSYYGEGDSSDDDSVEEVVGKKSCVPYSGAADGGGDEEVAMMQCGTGLVRDVSTPLQDCTM
eukprot:jgi/Mesvir1/13340/Mv07737-RA.1